MNEIEINEILKNHDENNSIQIANGKSKTIYSTIHNDLCLMKYKPHLRSITSNREENISGTDYWRMRSTLDIFKKLEKSGIPTHLAHDEIIEHNDTSSLYLLVKKVTPIPIEWICRYIAAGSIVRLFPSIVRQGQVFQEPLLKYDFKQDISVSGVDDPTLNESYIVGLKILTREQLDESIVLLKLVGQLVNECLFTLGIKLIDMKMEFGFDSKGKIIVIDEISQDCIRAEDMYTGLPLTKDVFRQLKTPEEIIKAYENFANRLSAISRVDSD